MAVHSSSAWGNDILDRPMIVQVILFQAWNCWSKNTDSHIRQTTIFISKRKLIILEWSEKINYHHWNFEADLRAKLIN